MYTLGAGGRGGKGRVGRGGDRGENVEMFWKSYISPRFSNKISFLHFFFPKKTGLTNTLSLYIGPMLSIEIISNPSSYA